MLDIWLVCKNAHFTALCICHMASDGYDENGNIYSSFIVITQRQQKQAVHSLSHQSQRKQRGEKKHSSQSTQTRIVNQAQGADNQS